MAGDLISTDTMAPKPTSASYVNKWCIMSTNMVNDLIMADSMAPAIIFEWALN